MGYVSEMRALIGRRPLVLAGANVLILDGAGRVLLHRRVDDGRWGILGGIMELGETLEETARREMREEIGIEVGDLTLVDLFSGAEFFKTYPNGDQVYPVGAVYVTREVRGVLAPDPREVMALQYFPLDGLPDDLEPISRLALERYRRGLHSMGEL